MMGIDGQVQERMDAFRGNPQGLAQRYQQNQELLDLLALQKLKSEKEATARQLQMQMQQNPQTIAQQREQEVFGLTKQELAQGTTATAQQEEQRAQSNLQRIADQGVAALPSKPMQMAEGGIVASGTDDWRARQIAAAAAQAESMMENMGENPWDQKFGRSATLEPTPRATGAMEGRGPLRPESAEEVLASLGVNIPQFEVPKSRPRIASVTPVAESGGGAGGVGMIQAAQPRPVSRAGMGEEIGRYGQGIEALAGIYGRQDRLDAEKARQERLRAIDSRQMDPDKLRRERLMAFLTRAGQGSTPGLAMAGGAAASMDTRRQQEMAERQRELQLQELERSGETRDLDLLTKAGDMTRYATASADGETDRRSREAQGQADRENAVAIANQRATLLAQDIQSKLQRGMDPLEVSAELRSIEEELRKAKQETMQAVMERRGIMNPAQLEELTPEEQAAFRAEVEEVMGDATNVLYGLRDRLRGLMSTGSRG